MMLPQHHKLNRQLLQGFSQELVSLFLLEKILYFIATMVLLCKDLLFSMLSVHKLLKEVIFPEFLEIRDLNRRLQTVMMLVSCRVLGVALPWTSAVIIKMLKI